MPNIIQNNQKTNISVHTRAKQSKLQHTHDNASHEHNARMHGLPYTHEHPCMHANTRACMQTPAHARHTPDKTQFADLGTT